MNTFSKSLFQMARAKAIWSLLCLLFTANAFATDYYVATNGDNNNYDGRSRERPFQTIQKAADMAVSGDVVYVLAGTYREQVDIKSNGVTFKPYGSDRVTINGADLMRNWISVSGSTYKTTMDWNVNASWGSNQLFQDGTMIELARWPKQTSTDIISPTNAKADTAYHVTIGGVKKTVLYDAEFNEPDGRWTGAQIWVNLAHDGADGQGATYTVLSTNRSAHTITLDNGVDVGGEDNFAVGARTEYFMFNPTLTGVNNTGGINSVLGAGEWWKDANTLYVKTRNGNSPNNNPNLDGTGGNVVEAKKRHFAFWASTTRWGYTIEKFHLFGCTITTDKNAPTNRSIPEDAHDITLRGLTVKYPSHQTDMSGNYQDQHYVWTGIVLSGRNNTIENCEISLSATSALSFIGSGNKMLNNRIFDTNYMCSNSGAINTGFVCEDFEIANNKIWNTTVIGINIRYAKNSNPDVRHRSRIHHNEIFDFMRRSYDSGAIDAVGQDIQWTRIDHNRIYNTRDDARIGKRKYGIYLDYGDVYIKKDFAIRATIDHNVVYQVNNPITINPGSDVHIFNNVLLGLKDSPPMALEPGKALSLQMNPGENANVGKNVRAYNNILSGEPYLHYTNSNVSLSNNITNAKDGVLAELFVDATNSNLAARDYSLKETATAAIDRGISVVQYTSNYDEPVVGITDIGAFERGGGSTPPTQPGSVDRTDPVGSGTILVRGENTNRPEDRTKAFDNDDRTKWLDSTPNGQSWIQLAFEGSNQYAINKYTITSANDSEERDPKDWKLYGTNTPDATFPEGYVELNAQSNVVFDSRFLKREFTFSNSTVYRAYRLVITANKSTPTATTLIQLAEIELFGPECSNCRTSAEVESGALTLAMHPNPTSRDVTINLAGFKGESTVQVKMSDMAGKLFIRQQVQPSTREVTIPVGHLPQGLFIVTVQGSKAARSAKLIITK